MSLYNRIPLFRDIRVIRNEVTKLAYGPSSSQTNTAIILNDFHLENHPRYNDPLRLLKYGHQVNSQNAEDGMIREIFRCIGVTNRIFAEIGIEDGSEINTSFLLSQ